MKKIPRESSKRYAKMPRFPRLNFVDKKVQFVERMIHRQFLKTAKRKNFQLRNFDYDVYKGKSGWRAKYAFLTLAKKLIDKNIDPGFYIKIMSRFGKLKHARYMPNPVWLSKDKTLEQFEWFHRSERKCFPHHLDFKKAISGWSDLDIYAGIRDSAHMVRNVSEGNAVSIEQAFLLLLPELNPWFVEAYIATAKGFRDVRKIREFKLRNKAPKQEIERIVRLALKNSGLPIRMLGKK